MSKLVTIERIENITPIEGADAIETAWIGGWASVIKKGEFKVGDNVVYARVDSWIPTNLAPFLSKGKEPREYNGVKGERLRTVRLRGQISQGLILNLDQVLPTTNSFLEGDDVSEVLGIQKWEAPINPQLAGTTRGNFPSQVPKTDQERIQNLHREFYRYKQEGLSFSVEEKLEGTSFTAALIDGDFHVCSRNLSLKDEGENLYWKIAKDLDIETKLRNHVDNIAIQGEIVGEGIQGNIYGIKGHRLYIFDVYDIKTGKFALPTERYEIVNKLGLNNVPVVIPDFTLENKTPDDILKMADGNSVLKNNQLREGLVFKCHEKNISFKSVSNAYLLKHE